MSKRNEAIAEMIARGRKIEEARAEGRRHSGPAGLPGDPDTSRAKVTHGQPLRDRFEVAAPEGGFSHLKPGQYADEPTSCAAKALA